MSDRAMTIFIIALAAGIVWAFTARDQWLGLSLPTVAFGVWVGGIGLYLIFACWKSERIRTKEPCQTCVYCGKEITRWDLFKGWFWKLPLRVSEFSYVWEQCCSYKCYGLQLEKMLRALARDSREVMDLADFLLLSASKFLTTDELLASIDKIKTTEWAKHIIAAGYRKVEASSNPYRLWHERDGLGLEAQPPNHEGEMQA